MHKLSRQSLFCEKIRKHIISLSFAVFAQRIVKVNICLIIILMCIARKGPLCDMRATKANVSGALLFCALHANRIKHTAEYIDKHRRP